MGLVKNMFVLPKHIVQSKEWGKFKSGTGKLSSEVGAIRFSVHQLPTPLSRVKIGYCPKVNPSKIKWKKLIDFAEEKRLCAIRFDVPNIIKDSELARKAEKIFGRFCVKSPKNTFATRTIILDITKPKDILLAQMNSKTRYNIRLAQRKGVSVRVENNAKALEIFIKLQKETASKQNFYIHSDDYYRKAWEALFPKKMVHILIAFFEGEPLVAWFLVNYKRVLYYPYGGSSHKHRKVMASNLIMWESILLGKKMGCKLFDMWGTGNPNNKNDPWSGFTKFKLGYGGKIVEFIDSYDLVINPLAYRVFNSVYTWGWRLLKIKSRILSFF